jgi:diguanylate cyclase (GGDEF)-like protein
MKVLVADDDRSSRLLVSALVRRLGYDVCQAADGLEALAALRSPSPPQLAILDWVMPGLDGLRLCRAIRGEGVDHYTYIILLTAKDSADAIVEGLDSGADDFIAKPVDQEVLGARLRSGQRVIDLQEQLISARERLREQATHDALTGLWNRGAILEIMNNEIARCSRENRDLGVILCDLDHFKQINDTYGHLAGDLVLHEAAQRLKSAVRHYDYVGRYGGEEFLIILPDCPPAQTVEIAERTRAEIGTMPFKYQGVEIPVSVSMGVVAQTPGGLKPVEDLLLNADDCLLEAKRRGRNRVVLMGN